MPLFALDCGVLYMQAEMEQSAQQIRPYSTTNNSSLCLSLSYFLCFYHTKMKNDDDDDDEAEDDGNETNNMLWWESASWNEMPVMAYNIPDSRQLQDYTLIEIMPVHKHTHRHTHIDTLFNMDYRVESVEN